ncbi:Protoporphyrin uptake protein [Lachnellula suecica]|uniref:Protoporphyrin uptake protein n=1 Tax=Lachnellula suecica TaxID=602035 RepID=A0A8T9CHK9_9HELO|nr:Protoporphyrin uptake protein [Lachnellula suecica]
MALHLSYYSYAPSLPAAAVAAALYTLVFAATAVQWIRYRAWVWIVMVLASGMEAAGYIARCLSTQKLDNQTLYVLQFSLIILAPVLMAGACYVVFGRIVYHVVPTEARTTSLLWISPRWLTPIFVVCDIVALFLQLVGAVIITSIDIGDPDAVKKANRGKHIAEIGVAVQLICFGLFSIIAVRFNFTSKRFMGVFHERFNGVHDDKYFTIGSSRRKFKSHWQAILRVTNFTSVCILIRSVYRMVDFALGRKGYMETHEWCLYVLDALVIFPVPLLFVWWHPGAYLPYMGFRLPKAGR